MSETETPADATATAIDESLLYFAQLVEGFAAVVTVEGDGGAEEPSALSVEEVRVALPVEFEVNADERGRVVIGSAPPTQHTETTVMPVFHRLSFRLVRDRDE